MFTYGDGVADLEVKALVEFHKSHGKLATGSTVRSPARFGRIAFDGDRVTQFFEKPESSAGWINGGYFVLDPKIIGYIDGDHAVWEREPVVQLTREGQLVGYRHYSFWSCMDTLKEKNILEELWATENAPWKIWK